MKAGRKNLSVSAPKKAMDKFELDNVWNRYRPDLEAELRFVVGRASLPLYDMMRYHMGWIDESGRVARNTAGKRLRPILCLLTCDSLGGHWRSALPVAAAIELVHNFSLIHDDIQDSSIERRGRPTVWYMWGPAQAINVGDGMHALALSSLLRLEDIGISNARIVRAARILGEASLRLCEGQYLDISYEKRMDIKINDYLTMISNKTAALIACSVEIGAILATENEADIAHLKSFGHALGMTFQIHDDVLSIWGDEKKIGKSVSTDIRTRKKTLPVVYTLEKAKGAAKARLLDVYKKEILEIEDEQFLLDLMDSLNARAHAQEMSKKFLKQSLSELDRIGLSANAREELEAVATFLLERES